ncbi:SDR family oxidoreductase [Streptomyces sp. NPDC051976]|uniref:SDR family oxidoreductase n=1 Tax=Streptomyces sp. NPDC051976 TaxID=3154947 RepID=UPI00343D6526
MAHRGLSGKVVLLTGTGALVEEVTQSLLAGGAQVALAGTLARGGRTVLPDPASPALPCRPGDPVVLGQAVDAVIDRFGRLDHVVNLIAAGPQPAPLMELDPLALRDILLRNLVMPLALVQRAYWRWMGTRGGSVINVVTDVIRDAPQDTALAGLTAITEWLSAELAPDVRVHTLMPGPSLGPDAYQAAIAGVLYDLLPRSTNGLHEPVLVLTEPRVSSLQAVWPNRAMARQAPPAAQVTWRQVLAGVLAVPEVPQRTNT